MTTPSQDSSPLSRLFSGSACSCRRAAWGKTVLNGGMKLDFCDLSAECFCEDPLAEQLDAIDPRFVAAAAKISTPFAPDRASKTSGSLNGVVVLRGIVRGGIPQAGILVGRCAVIRSPLRRFAMANYTIQGCICIRGGSDC